MERQLLIYVTLCKILDLCEPVFSTEDGHK